MLDELSEYVAIMTSGSEMVMELPIAEDTRGCQDTSQEQAQL